MNLPEEILRYMLSFFEPEDGIFLMPVCRQFCETFKKAQKLEYPIKHRGRNIMELISNSYDLIDYAVHVFPKQDRIIRDNIAFYVASNDNWPLIKRLQGSGYVICKFVQHVAAERGNLNILKWLWGKGYRIKSRVIHYASYHGNLEILQWLKSIGQLRKKRKVFIGAVLGGHINILEWAHENKCPWEDHLSADLASLGHYDALKWLHQKGYAFSDTTINLVIGNGSFEMTKWLYENGHTGNWDTMDRVIYYDRLIILKWLCEKGLSLPSFAHEYAARHGSLYILEWLICEKGYTLSVDIFKYATTNNNIEILEWLREKRCPWGPEVTAYANKISARHSLNWLVQNGCPFYG